MGGGPHSFENKNIFMMSRGRERVMLNELMESFKLTLIIAHPVFSY